MVYGDFLNLSNIYGDSFILFFLKVMLIFLLSFP